MPNDAGDIGAYFDRIGYGGEARATLPVLQELHWHHVSAIPFENLDVLLGRRIALDPARIAAKLVAARRGGYCFEQNSLYLSMLQQLGFKATALSARVWWGKKDGALPQRSHMALKVELGGAAYLCDVGFGGLTPVAPLRWEINVPQKTSHETYRLTALADPRADGEIALQAEIDGGWETLYSFRPQVVDPADFAMANWYVSTHPDSFFTWTLIAARPFDDGRHVLQDAKSAIRDRARRETTRQLGAEGELATILAETFGLDLPAVDVSRLWARLPLQ
ncbi:MAG: arylamine N-acetyltransferase [Proteobacteria bacterium]|nr:arylamine N-acetyltransferase [Pseudomonadota bacterium]